MVAAGVGSFLLLATIVPVPGRSQFFGCAPLDPAGVGHRLRVVAGGYRAFGRRVTGLAGVRAEHGRDDGCRVGHLGSTAFGGYRPSMSINRISVAASPEDVFSILANPYRYAEWVVGAREIRGVEGDWPSAGARFHHSIGFGPVAIKDQTKVVEADAPTRLVLEAQVRPFLTAAVTLAVTPTAPGSDVVMEEHPVGPLPIRIIWALLDPLTSRRNDAALRRLKEIVERRTSG